eukprot:CAMPEP_0113824920 /NCGR_PEP_ID=MMETSP0328-20130328/3487_1 /TAXON_ID=39455 /ORGANISM="Alexandrium minutum" /LENGTH=141 /DNA_ID=CAMNT_0000792867 /DNA_START=57 /DNA_END=484 /DNA_ORIENTATION=- /assembly_acc=CAM_ASM_000350
MPDPFSCLGRAPRSEGAAGAGVGAVGEERDQADHRGAGEQAQEQQVDLAGLAVAAGGPVGPAAAETRGVLACPPKAPARGAAPVPADCERPAGATKDSCPEKGSKRQATPASSAMVRREPAFRIPMAAAEEAGGETGAALG